MEQGLHEKGKKKVKCTGSTDPLPGVRVNLTMPFLTQTLNPTMYKTQPFVSFKTDFTKWARCKQINKWDLVQSCNPRLVGPKESQKKGMERPKATSGSDDPSHSPVGLLDPLQG